MSTITLNPLQYTTIKKLYSIIDEKCRLEKAKNVYYSSKNKSFYALSPHIMRIQPLDHDIFGNIIPDADFRFEKNDFVLSATQAKKLGSVTVNVKEYSGGRDYLHFSDLKDIIGFNADETGSLSFNADLLHQFAESTSLAIPIFHYVFNGLKLIKIYNRETGHFLGGIMPVRDVTHKDIDYKASLENLKF